MNVKLSPEVFKKLQQRAEICQVPTETYIEAILTYHLGKQAVGEQNLQNMMDQFVEFMET